ncbi:hypothetical protein [Amycolatopsis camponoti]|uniref:hypothetical protein n=1 Tax=Amycolatopsis camponoti TaxID=2606593 RepID=UPI001E3B54F4|nr:hypothetical protein [Amycolatopsis camponoti]
MRIGFGAGIAAVVLSACTGPQDSPNGAQPTPAATTATATTAIPAPTSAPPAKPVPAKVTEAACASATKATLEAAVKADKDLSGALIIDSKGLQRVKCVGPWAFAHFTNEIDGGGILFNHRNGTWIAQGGGTGELCEKVPVAIAKKICS